jgi:hypothetical protein
MRRRRSAPLPLLSGARLSSLPSNRPVARCGSAHAHVAGKTSITHPPGTSLVRDVSPLFLPLCALPCLARLPIALSRPIAPVHCPRFSTPELDIVVSVRLVETAVALCLAMLPHARSSAADRTSPFTTRSPDPITAEPSSILTGDPVGEYPLPPLLPSHHLPFLHSPRP